VLIRSVERSHLALTATTTVLMFYFPHASSLLLRAFLVLL